MHAGEMCTCQVARTRTTHESRCTLWRVFGSMVCCFLAKLLLGPPHYHGAFQTCQTWRVGVCMLAKCARAKSNAHSTHTSREMSIWEYVFFFGQVGTWFTTLPWHLSNVPDVASGRMYAGEMCTCQVARFLTSHESSGECLGVLCVVFLACVWEYGVLFFGQV